MVRRIALSFLGLTVFVATASSADPYRDCIEKAQEQQQECLHRLSMNRSQADIDEAGRRGMTYDLHIYHNICNPIYYSAEAECGKLNKN